MKNHLVLLLMLLLFAACKDVDESVQAVRMSAPEAAVADNDASVQSVMLPKIIREGSIKFETDDLDETYNRIRTAVKKYNGAVENDVSGKDYESLFRNVTVRVPSANFEVFVSDISKGVGYFDRKEISARDVTEEFIDVSARLNAKKQLEARYLELLKKATKVSEILEIEKELSVVREEIESKEGQLKFLESRVAMSTLTIVFYKKTAIESGMTTSYGSKIWNALKSGFNAFSGFLIGVLYIWPFIVILVVLFFILRKKLRKRKSI